MSDTVLQPPAPRKRTAKQQEASRNNGRKSKGPVTEAGKQQSCRGAYKHGLFSLKLFTLDVENSGAFHQTLEAFLAEWRPAGPTEESLVRSLAFETIALERFRMMEAQTFNGMTDRLDTSIFKNGQPEDAGEVLTGSFELFCKHGCLPNLEFIERAIARSGRNFRASLTSLIQLRKSGQPAKPPVRSFDFEIDRRPPTPPGEPSESLERRIAEFKRQQAENAARQEKGETNPGPTQPASNECVAPSPSPASPLLRTPKKEEVR
jgi:hypothetical protein